MVRVTVSSLVVVATLVVTASPDADARWVRVSTVTVDGVANALPSGQPVIGYYESPGVYFFHIDPSSPGISYHGNPLSKPKLEASFMLLDNNGSNPSFPSGKFFSFGLSLLPGPSGVTYATQAGIGNLFFIYDTAPSDNKGYVRIFVDKWQ